MSHKNLPVINTTCFAKHKMLNVSCKKSSCRHWIPVNEDGELNCAIITAYKGPQTLEKIGSIFNLTRMRICQIEKEIKTKISESI